MAVLTSLRAVRENPVTMAIWGLIVAAVLAIGFLPLFVGLAVAVPILAHASWHLFRKVVEPAELGGDAGRRRAPADHGVGIRLG